ncbi:MAG TPA: hydrogenase maturation protease [Bryobacteraceae bacterium]|nr:hydrogenase maturation protease [Bryobacteraceae bacterium]
MSNGTESGLIIGVGNEFRGDDALGLIAARMLAEAGISCTIVESTGGANLMDEWRGASSLIVIDAVCSGAAPGTIHRWDANRQELPERMFPTTHDFGLAEAVEMSRILRELPPEFLIFGIEAAQFDMGAPLSPEVQSALPVLVNEILLYQNGES